MISLIQRLKQQVLSGQRYSGSAQELIAQRIAPDNLEMPVFTAWVRRQREVVTYLRKHIEEFTPEERIRVYTAMTEFDKKCCVPYLARRELEENDPEAKAFLKKLLTDFDFQ